MEHRRLLELFVEESRDHLVAVDGTLERIERGAVSEAELRELMRHAHSFKGMAMSLGYGSMVSLAHALEDLFEDALHRAARPPADLLEWARDGWTIIGTIVDRVERGEPAEHKEARRLAQRIRGQEAPPVRVPASRPDRPDRRPDSLVGPRALLPSRTRSRRFKIEILLYRRATRSAAQTVSVFRALSALGRVERVDPPLQAGRSGRFEGRLALLLRSDASRADLERELRAMPEVAAFNVQPRPEIAGPDDRGPERKAAWARVRADLLDDVLARAADLFHEHRRTRAAMDEGPAALSRHLDRTEFRIKELYAQLGELRLVSFENLVARLKQTARELCRELAKPARLSVEGAEIQADRSIVDALVEPLLHAVRNALDHGIESAATRASAGKPAEAALTLRVRRHADLLEVVLEDDGRGLDPEALRRAAVERDLVTAERAAGLTDAEALLLATLPSLSTAARPTRISGRGVGMDVVRRSAERLGGRLILESEPGQGTRVGLRIPSMVALLRTLILRCSAGLFAVPAFRVRSTLSWENGRSPDSPGPSSQGRDGLRITRLTRCLGQEDRADEARTEIALLLDVAQRNVGLLVDEVIGRRDVIVQALGPPLNETAPYSGAAMLEDGSIVLVLDADLLFPGTEKAPPVTVDPATVQGR